MHPSFSAVQITPITAAQTQAGEPIPTQIPTFQRLHRAVMMPWSQHRGTCTQLGKLHNPEDKLPCSSISLAEERRFLPQKDFSPKQAAEAGHSTDVTDPCKKAQGARTGKTSTNLLCPDR